tara:strand:- start:808 stop:2739 length:1932 start_codon:yes stop_codon:yes gene_type:complete
MANLVQAAEELEYVPKDQLVEMSQNPDSRYPQYLVLSEIQRRTQMEKMYRAQEASMNQPQTTVAEEVVADFAQPQGLAGMNAEGPVNAGAFSPEAMPATPMQMAEGGETVIDKWFGNKYLNPFVSDAGTAKWYNPVAALPHVAYQNVAMTGDPLGEDSPIPAPYIKEWHEGLGVHTPSFDLEEYERRKQEELEKLYAENPQNLVGPSGMASGGITGYQNTGTTSISDGTNTYSTYSGPNARLQLLASLGIDPTGMSEQEIQQALQFAVSAPIEQEQLPIVDTGVNQPVDLTEVSSPRVPSVDTPEEDSWLDRAGSWAKDRYTDEGEGLGAVDWSNVLMDASWAIPGTAAVKGLGYAGKLGLGAYRSGKAAETAAKAVKATTEGAKKVGSTTKRYADPRVSPLLTTTKKLKPGSAADKLGYGTGQSQFGKVVLPRRPSATRIGLTTTGLVGANMTHNYLSDDEVIESKEKEKEIVETTQDKLNKLLADINKTQDTGTTEKKGLASFLPQAEGLDIAQLGGIIMGARNMSELGAGIAGLAGSIQDRRTKEKLTDIQGDLYKSQTAKYEADVEMMEPNQLASMIETYRELMKNEREFDQDPAVIAEYQARIDAASKRWSDLMGVPFLTQAERDAERAKQLGLNITG